MSASNSRLTNAPKKRKPYNAPTLTKLTPEEGKTALEAKGLPDDENVPNLLRRQNLTGRGELMSMRRGGGDAGLPRAGIMGKVAS